MGFTKFDGGYVESLGADEAVYKVNYDNAYHLSYRKQRRGEIARDVVSEKYILGMRILMLGYAHAFKQMSEANPDVAEFEDDFKRMAARGAENRP